jgi:hypothetical protein
MDLKLVSETRLSRTRQRLLSLFLWPSFACVQLDIEAPYHNEVGVWQCLFFARQHRL